MLKDGQVRFDIPMTDTLLSRSLNQSYGQIPAKNFNKTFSTHLPWDKMVMFVTGIFECIFGNKKVNFSFIF